MKRFRIVKKGVVENFFNPDIKISPVEYISFVESSDILSWREETPWGKKLLQEDPEIPVKVVAYLNFDFNSRDICFVYLSPPFDHGSCGVTFDFGVTYVALKAVYDIAQEMGCNLWDESSNTMVTESHIKALRIKEENRGIKLSNEQSHVLESIEDQCRWFYIPTDDVDGVLKILDIQPNIQEADITTIIDDVQRENKIAIATFTGHTILFGLNAPYITYPDLSAYLDKKDLHTPHLRDTLNKLSKAFGKAAYFEYNNDDELAASLAWSSKGKFVYGKFTSEGEGMDIFGTQKKPIEVNQNSILKTAQKLGMTPEDILTGLMKQKQKVAYFTQCDWNIEDMMKRYSLKG